MKVKLHSTFFLARATIDICDRVAKLPCKEIRNFRIHNPSAIIFYRIRASWCEIQLAPDVSYLFFEAD